MINGEHHRSTLIGLAVYRHAEHFLLKIGPDVPSQPQIITITCVSTNKLHLDLIIMLHLPRETHCKKYIESTCYWVYVYSWFRLSEIRRLCSCKHVDHVKLSSPYLHSHD